MKRLFKKVDFIQKLHARLSACGESIVETLAAVLVCSLAILMMYTAIASASRMNSTAENQALGLREDIAAVESQAESKGVDKVSISGFDEQYTVEYFVGENNNISSYRLRK